MMLDLCFVLGFVSFFVGDPAGSLFVQCGGGELCCLVGFLR